MTRTNSSLFCLLYSNYSRESSCGLRSAYRRLEVSVELWVHRIIIYVLVNLDLFCEYDKKKTNKKVITAFPFAYQ